jgi:small subunit ribosomal protein S20
MANIESQKKRIITNEKARVSNVNVKSEVKTAVKAFNAAVTSGNKEEAVKLANVAFKLIDESVSKSVQHEKTAARQKSHIQLKLNSLK